MTKPVLKVDELVVHIADQPVVDGVSFQVNEGEILSVVGESGCGKSLTAFSVMGLLPKVAKIASGSIWFGESDLVSISDKARRGLRGNDLAIIFQEPVASLNPLMKIGRQIEESLVVHRNERQSSPPCCYCHARRSGHSGAGNSFRAISVRAVRRHVPACHDCYGFDLPPRLLIADEPTTALDVTIQAQILDLMKNSAMRPERRYCSSPTIWALLRTWQTVWQ